LIQYTDVYLAKLDTTTARPLNIAASSGLVTLSWPVIADGYYLESRSDFGAGAWASNSTRFKSLVLSSS
jgi:hypothetical protein